jgi:hypothetical protein
MTDAPCAIMQDYLSFTEKSASPESYHIWTYLSMVASVLGKKTFIRCNYFNVYPNMYIILASMPGVGKKSTAMRIGRQLVNEADDEMVKYSNDSQTPQALMIEMQKSFNIVEVPNGKLFGSSALTVLASELVSLLFSGPAMVDFLTDIYDSDKKFEYKTKNMGSTIIKNPCLNIMAGVTTDSLNARVIRDATAGGFMSRSVVIYDNNTRSSSAFDMPSNHHNDARDRVVERFRQINDVYGEMSFTKSAIKMYQEYELVEEAALKLQPINVEFRSRKPIHVLKVAMLIAASDLRIQITDLDLTVAIGLLEKVEHNMQYIHLSSGGHKNAEIHSRIILALGKVEEIDYHDLLTHFMSSTDEDTFTRSIDTLVVVKWIKKTRIKTCTPHRTVLTLTDKGKEKFNKYE